MRFLIPHWGSDSKHRELLGKWFGRYHMSGCKIPVTVISDDKTEPLNVQRMFGAEWRSYRTSPPGQYPFDTKGEIVCAAIVDIQEPVLVLDADAFLQRCPQEALTALLGVPFAMPEDEGRRGLHLRNRHAQETDVLKRCAGVLWFGQPLDPEYRQWLVKEYQKAFSTMQNGKWHEPRYLCEQNAWTLVAHWHTCPILSRLFNWADHITSIGPNSEAYICHHIGQRKFNIATAAPRA
jgi:hypothetical protein